jgi:hypothetical protein
MTHEDRTRMLSLIQNFIQERYTLAGLANPLYGFETMAMIYEEHLWENRITIETYADKTTLATRIEDAATIRSQA